MVRSGKNNENIRDEEIPGMNLKISPPLNN